MWTSWAGWLGLRPRSWPRSLEAVADRKGQACLCAGQAHRVIAPNSTHHFWIQTVYYFHRQQKQEQKRCQLPVGLFPQDNTKRKGARWQCSLRTSVPGCWGANWCCSLGPQPAAVPGGAGGAETLVPRGNGKSHDSLRGTEAGGREAALHTQLVILPQVPGSRRIPGHPAKA